MGLDSVHLIMGMEKAFGLEIPNPVAERLQTVRDVIDYVVEREPVAPATTCSTQQTFYVIRRALRPAAGREHRLTPDTRLAELTDRERWPRTWKQIRGEGDGAWPASVPWKGWWRDGPETLGELTLYVVAARPIARHPEGKPWTRDEVTGTVRQVIWDELGIWKACLDDSFVEDLGVD
jgi:hypothetical protein